uniref:Uncharacterized protein n=1 Tax=Rhizophora mucronata TaxID=61149 RepID=A0A2P2L724_RHIMU
MPPVVPIKLCMLIINYSLHLSKLILFCNISSCIHENKLTIMDDGKDQKDGNLGSSSPAATENRMPSPDGPYVMASWISNDHGIISRAKQDAESTTRGRGRGSGEGTSCTCCNIM